MAVSIALETDIPSLVMLLNRAYRGEASKKGWTTEAEVIAGELRTDDADMLQLMHQPDTVFLKYINKNNEIEGCVLLQKRKGKMYLGMLSVNPEIQAKGIGKEIMAAAEDHARQQQCPAIFMRVISLRHELIAWYERKGYYQTGEHEPFENTRFGKATTEFDFIVMQKDLQ